MKLTSSVFEHNSRIPEKYTCDGENISPPLDISGVPEGTRQMVLIVDDPDAPREKPFLHWLMWEIDPQTRSIGEGRLPKGAVQGQTDAGSTGYTGPCPPSGTHRYFFRVYALDYIFDLGESASRDDVARAMSGHILGAAELVGMYSRK